MEGGGVAVKARPDDWAEDQAVDAYRRVLGRVIFPLGVFGYIEGKGQNAEPEYVEVSLGGSCPFTVIETDLEDIRRRSGDGFVDPYWDVTPTDKDSLPPELEGKTIRSLWVDGHGFNDDGTEQRVCTHYNDTFRFNAINAP